MRWVIRQDAGNRATTSECGNISSALGNTFYTENVIRFDNLQATATMALICITARELAICCQNKQCCYGRNALVLMYAVEQQE